MQGTKECFITELNILVIEGEIIAAESFNNLQGIPSRPVAFLEDSFESNSYTVLLSVGWIENVPLTDGRYCLGDTEDAGILPAKFGPNANVRKMAIKYLWDLGGWVNLSIGYF